MWKYIVTNFKNSYVKLSYVCYAMEKTYTIFELNNLMKKVEQTDVRIKDYLQLANYDKWIRMHATINREFTFASNIAENINKHLKKVRKLALYDFLDEVRNMFSW